MKYLVELVLELEIEAECAEDAEVQVYEMNGDALHQKIQDTYVLRVYRKDDMNDDI